MRGAIAEGRVAAFQLEVGTGEVGDVQTGFIQVCKRPTLEQQLAFKRTPAGPRLPLGARTRP